MKVSQWLVPLVSLAISLAIGEAALRFLEKPLKLKFPGLSRYFAEAIYFEKLPDSKPNPPAMEKFHPRLGWKASGHGNPVINPQGWRHHRSYSEPSKGIRILIVGDSFTYGSGVPWEGTLNFHLQQRLGSNFEVFNIAAEGFTLDQIAYASMEEAFLYQPDMIISGFIADDVRRSCLGFGWTHAKRPFYEKVENGFVLTGVPVPSPDEVRASAKNIRSAKVKSLLASSRVISAFLEPLFILKFQNCVGERAELLNYLHQSVGTRTKWLGVLVDGELPNEFKQKVATGTPLVFAEKEIQRLSEQLQIKAGRSDTYHFDSNGNRLIAELYAENVLAVFGTGATVNAPLK